MNLKSIFAIAASSAVLLSVADAQLVGTNTPEKHPAMTSKVCSAGGSCKTESTSIVLDANWRWLHKGEAGSTNCYDGNKFDSSVCKTNDDCAKNCAVDGADYEKTYGIKASGDSVTLQLATTHEYGTNIGGRVYLMASETKYRMFKLLNKEFTFDVDTSELPCGLNGALYFSEMPEDGGMGGLNKAGAKYGTGYCDAQCPQDLKFVGKTANAEGWTPSKTDKNAGTGKAGACCAEMDIWEANSNSNAYTPHPCTKKGLFRCEGEKECGNGDGNRYKGICDKDGCDYNPYRFGNKKFYGKGSKFKVDTSKKFTVVTQFITTDGTDSGDLKEIKRFYVQNGKKISNPKANLKGLPKKSSLTDKQCSAAKKLFEDVDDFKAKGGMKQMGAAYKNGMVLVMSLWSDQAAHCLWLDSRYPTDADPKKPGVVRGNCPIDSGDPDEMTEKYGTATVTYGNIRTGPLGSTTKFK